MSGESYEREAREKLESRAWLSTETWGVVIRLKNNDGKICCDLELMKALRDWLNIQIARVEKGMGR